MASTASVAVLLQRSLMPSNSARFSQLIIHSALFMDLKEKLSDPSNTCSYSLQKPAQNVRSGDQAFLLSIPCKNDITLNDIIPEAMQTLLPLTQDVAQ